MAVKHLCADCQIYKLLLAPYREGAGTLCIISSRATPGMLSWLMTTCAEHGMADIQIKLFIEAANKGIDEVSHNGFLELCSKRLEGIKLECSYLLRPLILKDTLYIWLSEKDEPIKAYISACDFTQASLFKQDYEKTVLEYPATDAYAVYEQTVVNSIYCNCADVEECVVIYKPRNSLSPSTVNTTSGWVHLSLLMRNGEIGTHSGLNWGQRSGRNKNEAYIPLPRDIARSGFFPLDKQHFLAVTDDHHTLLLRVEQQNDKAITTPASNAQLGEYFRNRLGLSNGAYVRTSDLTAYGRTDVAFYKIDDEQYYMDFSSNKEG